MDRRDSCLPEVEETRADAVPAKAQGINASRVHRVTEPPGEPEAKKHYRTIPPTAYQRPAGVSYIELQKQARRAKRYARYEDVRTLSGQGVSIREIARRLKLSRETIRRFLRAAEFPEMASGRRSQRGSILNPYKPYILQRWQQGCRNSVQLYDEIKTRGYSGSTSLLRNLSSQSSQKACRGRISGSFDL